MKRLFNKLFVVGALGTIGLLSSCSSDDEILVDPTSEFDVELAFSDNGQDVTEPFALPVGQTTVKARVTVTSDKNMKRVYITRNVAGQGDEPYTPSDLSNKATKPDGSIDVESSPKALDYQLNLEVPAGLATNGTVVYNFWATSGKGDYRDADNSYVAGIGSIVVTVGTGKNPDAELKSFSAKILAAPRNDLASESFISLLDGNLYKISQGAEYSAFWDFGYFYGSSAKKASLASTSAYEVAFGSTGGVPFIDVDAIAGTTDLNNAYFRKSTEFTAANFDAAAISDDLSDITKPSAQFVNNLTVGDVIEFVDQYGNNGLIKVTELFLGNSGNGYDSDAYIKIDVKVQP